MPHPKCRIDIICKFCGKISNVKLSRSGQIYCDNKCELLAESTTKTQSSCLQCGNSIITYKAHPQKYCSISCGIIARNLTEQNPSYHRDISGDKNPMFGKGRKGTDNGMFGCTKDKNPAWRGGRKIRKDGYILVYAPEHPCNNGKYVLEHRLIMEKHLGRYLLPDEVVHHIDENTSNNAIENLRLYANQCEHISSGHGSNSCNAAILSS